MGHLHAGQRKRNETQICDAYQITKQGWWVGGLIRQKSEVVGMGWGACKGQKRSSSYRIGNKT